MEQTLYEVGLKLDFTRELFRSSASALTSSVVIQLGMGSAAGSLALARRADDRELLEAGAAACEYPWHCDPRCAQGSVEAGKREVRRGVLSRSEHGARCARSPRNPSFFEQRLVSGVAAEKISGGQ